MSSTYPDVPDVPGVPPVPRDPNAAAAAQPDFLSSDSAGLPTNNAQSQWGLFLSGFPAITADNVVSFDYRQAAIIADYQIEEGGFETYDKVQMAFNVALRFSAGGSESNRQALIDSAQQAFGTSTTPNLSLYDAVTPEVTYQNVNVEHWTYRRTATNGVGLVTVEVWLAEVRVTASPQFTNATPITSPKSPTTQSTVSDGKVQPFQPTNEQQQSINSGIQY